MGGTTPLSPGLLPWPHLVPDQTFKLGDAVSNHLYAFDDAPPDITYRDRISSNRHWLTSLMAGISPGGGHVSHCLQSVRGIS